MDPASWLAAEPELEEAVLRQRVVDAVAASYEAKVARTGAPIMRHVEKDVMLRTLDLHWREHLAAMDYLRQGIHLRGYAQKDYRFEYKREAFELFAAMLDRVKFDTVSLVSKVEIRTQEEVDREEEMRRERLMQALQTQHAEAQSALLAAEPASGAGGTGALGGPAGGWRWESRPAAPMPPVPPMAVRPLSAAIAKWAATSPAPAVRARSSSTVTARCPARSNERIRHPAGGGRCALRCARPDPDRAASRGQAHGRALGVSRRQGGGAARPNCRR